MAAKNPIAKMVVASLLEQIKPLAHNLKPINGEPTIPWSLFVTALENVGDACVEHGIKFGSGASTEE